jgi:hypothetical protein
VRTYNKCKASGKCSRGVMPRADSANAYVLGIRFNAMESSLRQFVQEIDSGEQVDQ